MPPLSSTTENTPTSSSWDTGHLENLPYSSAENIEKSWVTKCSQGKRQCQLQLMVKVLPARQCWHPIASNRRSPPNEQWPNNTRAVASPRNYLDSGNFPEPGTNNDTTGMGGWGIINTGKWKPHNIAYRWYHTNSPPLAFFPDIKGGGISVISRPSEIFVWKRWARKVISCFLPIFHEKSSLNKGGGN